MGWVRGQTGEQKKGKKSKDLPGLGSGRTGQEDLGWALGAGCPQESCIHRVGEGPNRRPPLPDYGPSSGVEGGVAQTLSATGREKRGRTGRRRERPQGIPGLSAALNVLPGWHPKVRWLGVGRVQKQPARAGRAGASGRAEPPASQVAYSLSKAGLLNLQASL